MQNNHTIIMHTFRILPIPAIISLLVHFKFTKYSNHLNTGLVWYSNGRKLSGLQMVWYSNGI